MKKLLYILISILFFAACKTVKHSEKVANSTNTVEQKDLKTYEAVKEVEKQISETLDKTVTNNNLTFTKTETELSVPDTAGKQHIVKITVTEAKTESKQQANKQESKTLEKTKQTDNNMQDKGTVKTTTKTATDAATVVKTKTPLWVIALFVVLGLGFLYFLYRVLKRFGIL